jgi:hypothetical protein
VTSPRRACRWPNPPLSIKIFIQPIVQDSLHGTSLRDLRQRAAIR